MDLLRGAYGGASDGEEAEVRRRSPSPKRLRRELPAEPRTAFSCYSSAGPPLGASAASNPVAGRYVSKRERALLAAAPPPSHPLLPLPAASPGIASYVASSLYLIIL